MSVFGTFTLPLTGLLPIYALIYVQTRYVQRVPADRIIALMDFKKSSAFI